MTAPSASEKQSRNFLPLDDTGEQPVNLKFISDLGRSLLFTVHPKKVASRVSSAIQQAVDADVCALVAELDNIGVLSCAFDRRGEMDSSFLDRSRFERWLELLPPQVGHSEETSAEFLLSGADHKLEYVSPIHINGQIRGALVVAFASKQDLSDSKIKVIEAATQMAAMSINLSAHYEAAINSSIKIGRASCRERV